MMESGVGMGDNRGSGKDSEGDKAKPGQQFRKGTDFSITRLL